MVDTFGRIADDLRISVTDRCNFRCTYCMPAELTELLKLALRVEEHYGVPQDIEWAEAGGQFHILQARPVTTVGL